ncbi:unnamed protein product [Auanema sp. JU1783]|nr:unnamed protein product [Auanema sp. JU1783]
MKQVVPFSAMKNLLFITLISYVYSLKDQLDDNELQKMKAAVSPEILEAIGSLTDKDKVILYDLAHREDFFTAILIENPRLTDMATSIIKTFASKISKLDEKPKMFVKDTINSLRKLHLRAVQAKSLRLDDLASTEEKRFRALDSRDKDAIVQTFPILTDMGIFTNKKLQYIMQSLFDDAETAKKHAEL